MNNELEPIDISEKIIEFTDSSFAELVLEIHELRAELETEKKAHAAAKNGRIKAEEKSAELEIRISTAMSALSHQDMPDMKNIESEQ